MRHFRAAVLATAGLFVSSVVGDVDPIIIKGAKFFYKNSGDQFFFKGIAYQQDYAGQGSVKGADSGGGFNDPLANPDGCKRDIPYFQELKLNSVRVYAIDTDANHDECMSMLADAGIYVVADLSAPNNGDSINRDDPQWNTVLYQRYVSVIDVMSKYDNTIGYFAGNEVADAPNNTNSAPFVKAAVRDMKAYVKQKGYPQYVGYATDDNQYVRVQLADYFDCGNSDDSVDFWGYNIYSWCGNSNLQTSGYADRAKEFASYNVPSFFAEYGCITPPRLFTDVLALYGSTMAPVFSGGIVYEYFEAANNYGVVTVGKNQDVTKLAGFATLSSQMAKVTPSSTKESSYNPTNKAAACPKEDSSFRAQPTALPPIPNEQLCSCMYDAVECVPKSSTPTKSYGKLFSYICGKDAGACDGISTDSKTGAYGNYGMCNAKQQLAWAMNAYYFNQGKAGYACDFSGAAEKKSSSVSNTCKNLLAQAGAGGTGKVTASAVNTGGAGSSASGSASGSALSSRPETGLLPMACVVTLALISGVGAILL